MIKPVEKKKYRLILITIPPHGFKRYVELSRSWLKRLIGKNRGPEYVLRSLIKGLKETDTPHLINPSAKELAGVSADAIHVLSGTTALRQCIALKRKGIVKKLLAGPNLTMTPFEEHDLYLSPEIDRIIMPSAWPADYFIALAPELKDKIAVWPAGVDLPVLADALVASKTARPQSAAPLLHCLLYIKSPDPSLLQHIEQSLAIRNIPSIKIMYGAYDQLDYFDALRKSTFAIFLAKTESQGLALQEAWAHDVPTLVWNAKEWAYSGTDPRAKGYVHRDPKISAPYLTDECGIFFDGKEDFDHALDRHIAALMTGAYSPRAYVSRELSNKASALRLLQILDTMDAV